MSPVTTEPARPIDAAIDIRPLTTHEDLVACVALQREVWGEEFQECVAPALMKVTLRVGGILAGAVDGHDRLLGFVYGLSGLSGGRRIHWSHMLGVSPAARGLGIGRRLKEYQRARAAEQGAEWIAWTFDPLVARNAHLNLNLLGAEVAEYVPDMYPPMASKLHGTIPLDRFVVHWTTNGAPPASNGAGPVGMAAGSAGGEAVVLDWRAWASEGPEAVRERVSDAPEIRIVVPRDFDELVQSSPTLAHEVRSATRDFFTGSMAAGYGVVGFDRGRQNDPQYVLLRP